MLSLKNIKKIKKIDKSNMEKLLKNFPDQITKATKIFSNFNIPKDYKNFKNILVCGMGGSAISGDIVKDIVKDELNIPIMINKNYFLPKWVNKNSLVFVISHSGDTQETIEMYKQAQKTKAKIIIITGGGKLKEINKDIPLLDFPFQKPSRMNIGYSLTFIFLTLKKLKLISKLSVNASVPKLKEINKMFFTDKETDKNIAKYLAFFIFDHLPIITTNHELSGIGKRFKSQLSENSKMFSYNEELPEMIHNSIENKNPWRLKDEIVFLIFENIKKNKKIDITIKELLNFLNDKNIRWQKIPNFTQDKTTQILSLISLIDWISFYLAILEETNPTSVKRITKIKKKIYES